MLCPLGDGTDVTLINLTFMLTNQSIFTLSWFLLCESAIVVKLIGYRSKLL